MNEKVIGYVRVSNDIDIDVIDKEMKQLNDYIKEHKLSISIATVSDRTKSGRVKKGKSKKYAGGRVPYGYELLDGDTMIVNDAEALVVKKVYELRKDRKSLQKVADILNDEGILNKSGRTWSKQAIDYMIKNKVYVGEYEYDGKKEKNNITFKIPNIVSKQLWNKANN